MSASNDCASGHQIVGDEALHRLEHPRDPADQLSADRERLRDRVIDVLEQLARPIQQRFAGKGELDSVGGAPQQLAANQLLERADLAAERGLGHVQPLCGPAEVELLRDRDERPQVAQLDSVGGLREWEYDSSLVHGVKYGRWAIAR